MCDNQAENSAKNKSVHLYGESQTLSSNSAYIRNFVTKVTIYTKSSIIDFGESLANHCFFYLNIKAAGRAGETKSGQRRKHRQWSSAINCLLPSAKRNILNILTHFNNISKRFWYRRKSKIKTRLVF
jgi:hypothetical protein